MNNKKITLTYMFSRRDSLDGGHKPYLVLTRPSPNQPCDPCPFCRYKHSHGTPDGHRAAHCSNANANGPIVEKLSYDGFTFNRDDGYLVRTKGSKGLLKHYSKP